MGGKLNTLRVVLVESRATFLRAFRHTREDWRTLVRATGIFSACLAVVYTIGVFAVMRFTYSLAFTAPEYIRELQNILLNVIAMPFLAYFLGGLLQFFRERTRGTQAPYILLIKGHRHYFRILLYCLAYYAGYRAFVRTVVGIEDYPVDLRLRMLFGLPLFIWVITRVCFSFAFVTEQDAGPKLGIKSSFILTGGRFWRTLVILFPVPVSFATAGLCIGLLPHPVLVILALVLVCAALPFVLSVVFLSYFWLFDRYRQEPTVVEIAAVTGQ